MEKNQEFLWAEDQQKASEELKKRLISFPTLTYPDLDTDFMLDTDASDQGIEVVLLQKKSLPMVAECLLSKKGATVQQERASCRGPFCENL